MKKQINLAQLDLLRSFEPGQKIRMPCAGGDLKGEIALNGKEIIWDDGVTTPLEISIREIEMDEW